MTYLKTLLPALVFGLLPISTFAAGLGELRASLLDGDVQVKTQDSDEWLPAAINMPLADSDQLWVPARGRVELQARDGSYVRLNEYSALEILTLERDSYQFYLTSGQAYVNYKGRRDYFLQLDTPVAALRVYAEAVFRVDLAENSDTHITVIRGTVEAESRHGRMRVSAGNTLVLRGGAQPERYAAVPPDDWERWNARRDRERYEHRASARYLPDELESYAPDFDEYGRWSRTDDYGYVWIPSVHISVGWSPYRLGRWVWIGGDYVWISHEPWGWAPYHYGRWAFVGHLGWCWVPPRRGAVYWGPGYVGWSQHRQHVAWVPLAPGEIYYGHGHYGPHSVNLLHVDIRKTVVKHNYKNAHVRNGVTTLHRDGFLTDRRTEVTLKENLFLTETPRLGRPDLKPERATRRPAIKDIPRAQLPPPAIRDLPMRELKEARPLVKDRTAPVFKGDTRAQPRQVEQRPEPRPTERAPDAREVKPARSLETPAAGGKPRTQDIQQRPAREAKPVQPPVEREQRSAPIERRPEIRREPPRPAESQRRAEPPAPAYTPARQREAPQEQPTRRIAPAPERPAERVREINKPPEAHAPEAARKSAPVQPAREKAARDEQDKVNEGVRLR